MNLGVEPLLYSTRRWVNSKLHKKNERRAMAFPRAKEKITKSLTLDCGHSHVQWIRRPCG